MSQRTMLESVFSNFLVLFLVARINSQATATSIDSQQPNSFQTCDASSYCSPIRKCSSLRDGWNRRGVGITCGYGSGPYRMVCCPRVFGEEVPSPLTRRPTSATPISPPAKLFHSYSPPGNSKDCGLSQEIDWFQEHADDEDLMEATWPWMAGIKFWDSSGHSEPWCSGFLIDKTHVLSAAHCFNSPSDASRFSAHIGSDKYNSTEEYPIISIKKHEDYRIPLYYNDIAILTLEREVNISNFVPVCLPDDRMKDMHLIGWGTTVVGWGSERPNGQMSTSLKQLDNIPILSSEECYQIFKKLLSSFNRQFPRGISEGMLCAGQTEASRDACAGDSGGPMMILYRKRWYAVGITSFGYSCGVPGVPGGYTRISSYVDWIKQNIENGPSLIIPKIHPR